MVGRGQLKTPRQAAPLLALSSSVQASYPESYPSMLLCRPSRRAATASASPCPFDLLGKTT